MTSRRLSLLAIALCTSTALAQTPPPRPSPVVPAPGAATPSPAAAPTRKPRPQVAPSPFDRARYAIAHKTFVLDNGLRLVVHEDHSVPVVGVNLWYHVGSRNEERGKTGFAHLFEHFFFNGSEHYPHGFREAMDDLGANNRNGTTNTDRTNFFENVPVSGLERTLYLEADRLGYLAARINKEMLERERGVVQNEKRQGENQPYGRVFQRMTETVYPEGIRTAGPPSAAWPISMRRRSRTSRPGTRPTTGQTTACSRSPGTSRPRPRSRSSRSTSTAFPRGLRCAALRVGADASIATSATRWRIASRRRACTASITRHPHGRRHSST